MMFFYKLKAWWRLKSVKRDIRTFELLQQYEEDPYIIENLRNYCDQLRKVHAISMNILTTNDNRIFKQLVVEFNEAFFTLDLVTDQALAALKAHKERKSSQPMS